VPPAASPAAQSVAAAAEPAGSNILKRPRVMHARCASSPVFAAERPVLNRMLTIDVVQRAHLSGWCYSNTVSTIDRLGAVKMEAMMPEQSKMHFT
jgi:hypothetical protein